MMSVNDTIKSLYKNIVKTSYLLKRQVKNCNLDTFDIKNILYNNLKVEINKKQVKKCNINTINKCKEKKQIFQIIIIAKTWRLLIFYMTYH